jgi:putative transposase
MTNRKEAMTNFRPELLDELLGGAKTQEQFFGPGGVLPRLTAVLLERALQAELQHHLQREKAPEDPLSPQERKNNRRNGSSKKTLQTEHGPVPLDVPRDRNSTFEPAIVPKHSTRVPSLDQRILALYARGLSTRDIAAHLREIYGTDVSHELISEVTDAVNGEVIAWQQRPVERLYAVLWLDALMVKIRHEGHVQNKAVHVVIGLRMDGIREVLGLWIEGTEGAKFWLKVLNDLRARGLQDVLIACCDGLKGFPEAIEASFPHAVVQTCIVHQVRYSLSFVSWKDRKAVVSSLRPIYQAKDETEALQALEAFEQKWSKQYPMIVKSWENNWEKIAPFLSLPRELRRLVYTTNPIESLNYQLRRVLKTKGHFPNDAAALKLLFLAIQNIETDRKRPGVEWRSIFRQLVIHFGDRIPDEILRR